MVEFDTYPVRSGQRQPPDIAADESESEDDGGRDGLSLLSVAQVGERRGPKADAPLVGPPAPDVREKTLDFRDSKITLKTRDGTPFYLKDSGGEWDSTDGALWTRRGTGGMDTWRGTLSFDADNNYVEEGLTSGVKRVSRADGSTTTSMVTAGGKRISLTEAKDGTKEFSGAAVWRSTDGGKTWKNGDNEFKGQLGIDNVGRYWREPDGGKREIVEVSKNCKEINDRIAELEKKYNITVGTAGKVIKYDYSDPETDTTKTVDVTMRQPTLEELKTLEKCLKQYEHLAPKTADGHDFRGLRFNFISGAGDGDKVTLWGWYNSSKDGVPQVTFGPRNANVTNGWDGFEGTVLHEVAHHLQSKLWTADGGRHVPAEVMNAMGWRLDARTGLHQLRDKDGKYWESHAVRLKDKDTNKWYYSSRWYPVIDGVVVQEMSRARTNKEMYDNIPANRKPCTQYFTYPTEAHAEALAMLLQNPRMLHDRNKDLYEATRKWDQSDIDKRHGTADGKPKMIRSADGNIVPNTAENRRRVSDMEDGWRKNPASRSMRSSWESALASHDEGREQCVRRLVQPDI